MPKPEKALILIDLQNDFCRGGSLEVPDGDAVISLANQLQNDFENIVVTKDWHPADHLSFASNHPGKQVGDFVTLDGVQQILWPDHCVQGTYGAELHPQLAMVRVDKYIHKGTNKNLDSYSAFFDNAHRAATGLGEYLHQQGITELHIMGLATDYCVKFSCLDAIELGFKVKLIKAGCRGVELHPGDVQKAYAEMQQRGVEII